MPASPGLVGPQPHSPSEKGGHPSDTGPPFAGLPAGGGGPPELFRLLRYTPEQASRFGEFDYPAIVRLAPGVSAEQARPELTALTREAFGEFPFTITPIVRPLDLQIARDVRAPLSWLLS